MVTYDSIIFSSKPYCVQVVVFFVVNGHEVNGAAQAACDSACDRIKNASCIYNEVTQKMRIAVCDDNTKELNTLSMLLSSYRE
jgi:hypothetical protein